VLDGDLGLQLPRKPAGHLPGQPVLSPVSLQKGKNNQQEQKDGKQDTAKYFKKSPQIEICVKVCITGFKTNQE
jgi:hypothetical protein